MKNQPRAIGVAVLLLLASCGKGGGGGSELEAAKVRVEGFRGLQLERIPESSTVTSEELPGVLSRLLFPAKDKEKVKKATRLYSLLGLLPPNFNVKASMEKLLSQEALAFYVPAESRMYFVSDPPNQKPEVDKALREKGLPTVREATVAHELLHALQHQRSKFFSLEAKGADWDDVRGACRILAEGEATYLNFELWSKSAPFDGLWNGALGEALKAGDTTPLVIRRSLYLPYLAGSRYFRDHGAKDTGDRFYANPPVSTEQLLRKSYDLKTDPPIRIAIGDLSQTFGAGWSLATEAVLGAMDLAPLTFDRLQQDPRMNPEVLHAGPAPAFRWGGDRVQLYVKGSEAAVVLFVRWDDVASALAFSQRWKETRKDVPLKASGRSTVAVIGVSAENANEIAQRVLRQSEWAPFRSVAELEKPLAPRAAARTDEEAWTSAVEEVKEGLSAAMAQGMNSEDLRSFFFEVRDRGPLIAEIAGAYGALLAAGRVPSDAMNSLPFSEADQKSVGEGMLACVPWTLPGIDPTFQDTLVKFLSRSDPAKFGSKAIQALKSTGLLPGLKAWLLAFACASTSRAEAEPELARAFGDPNLAEALKRLQPRGNLRVLPQASFEAMKGVLYGTLSKNSSLGTSMSDPLRRLLFEVSSTDITDPAPELFQALAVTTVDARTRAHLLSRVYHSDGGRAKALAFLTGGEVPPDLLGMAVDSIVLNGPSGATLPPEIAKAVVDGLAKSKEARGPTDGRTLDRLIPALGENDLIRLAGAAAEGNLSAEGIAMRVVTLSSKPPRAFLEACLRTRPERPLHQEARKRILKDDPNAAASELPALIDRISNGDVAKPIEMIGAMKELDKGSLDKVFDALAAAIEKSPRAFHLERNNYTRVHGFLRDRRASATRMTTATIGIFKKYEKDPVRGKEILEACSRVFEAVLDPSAVNFLIQRFDLVSEASRTLFLTCAQVDKSLMQASDAERRTKAFWEKRWATLKSSLPDQLQ